MATQPYLGSIGTFGFTFAPHGYHVCDGTLLSISQNSALFALLGTQYGGNGTTTFGLPDLRSRFAIGAGQGAGLSPYTQGEVGGQQSVTLTTAQLPAHNHTFNTLDVKASAKEPVAGSFLARAFDGSSAGSTPEIYVPSGTTGPSVPLNVAGTISVTGSSNPVTILPPYLALNFSIALQGVFPSRN